MLTAEKWKEITKGNQRQLKVSGHKHAIKERGKVVVSCRAILAIICIAIIPLLGIAGTRMFLHIGISNMTRDVTAIAGIHPLSGILSSLGILLWWTSATVWFFAALLRRCRQEAQGIGFLVCSGLLSTYLALDDLFLFHEHLFPTYLSVSEQTVYAFLAVCTMLYLWRYRRYFIRSDGVLMLLALAFLCASVVFDAVLAPHLWHLKDWLFLVEDGLKWLGICFWTAFCIVRCTNDLRLAYQRGRDKRSIRALFDGAKNDARPRNRSDASQCPPIRDLRRFLRYTRVS